MLVDALMRSKINCTFTQASNENLIGRLFKFLSKNPGGSVNLMNPKSLTLLIISEASYLIFMSIHRKETRTCNQIFEHDSILSFIAYVNDIL